MDTPPVVTLGGYPPIHRIKFMQGSGARPGRCVIDAGNDTSLNIRNLPRDTGLTIDHRSVGFRGLWPYMRVVKCQRARNGHVRVVLEDQRWHLSQYKFSNNYNERDSLGNVMTSSRRSVAQLLQEISNVCQRKIVFSVSQAPSFEPPARWAGKSCSYALADLLKNTGCRCVYNPESQTYMVGLPQGGLPNMRDQVFQPAPPSNIRDVYVHSYPKLYERKTAANAVTLNTSTGSTQNINGTTVLTQDPTQANSQTLYRLWRVNDPTKVFTEFRVKTHLFDPLNPTFERGRVIRDEWDPFPVHQPFVFAGSEIIHSIDDTSGGKVFVTEHPVLSADGSNYSTTAKLLTGYYLKTGDGSLERETVKKTIDSSASSDVHIYVDWIRPIDSDQPDVGTPVWSQLLNQVAEALHRKYKGPAASISNPYPVSFGGHANVGEVEYEFRLSEIRSYHNFRVALNFSPGSEGEIR